jgi:hypothetical protein
MKQFVQKTIDQDEHQDYDGSKGMLDNVARISHNFKFGESSNFENFTNPKALEQTT